MFSAALKSGAAAAPLDPDFENVTMLLHGDGTNGAQNNTFLDSSANNFTITCNGNTTQGSFSPYGPNWSNFFDGTGDYLALPNNAAFTIGTGAVTIEAWIFCTSLSQVYQGIISGRVNTTDYPGLGLVIDAGLLQFTIFGQSAALTDTANVPLNQWIHVVGVRSGTNAALFVNGVRKAFSSSNTANGSYNIMGLGRYYPAEDNYYFSGYISNARIVKGTAVYDPTLTTLAVPTAPLTVVSGTSLLTCADNRFIDDSTNNFAVSAFGNTSVQRFSPFAPPAAYNPATIGGSGYFDGASDFLTIPAATALDISTGDFTIEAWVYLNVMPTTDNLIDFANWMAVYVRGNPSASDGWQFQIGQTVLMLSDSYGTAVCFGTHGMAARAWYHVSVTRSGNTFRVFVNGVQVGTATSSISLNTGATYWIGSETGQGAYLNGYLSNLRVVKGTAVYTANFTPPTAPVTAITNTSLLTNMTNGAIFDNAMMNDLETVGNAQISTSVVKFGTGSIFINSASAGSFLTSYNRDPINLGTGDFTVEAWIYPTQYTNDSLICKFITGGNVFFVMINSGQFTIVTNGYTSPSLGYSFFGALSLNTWTHIALTRVSGTCFGYINGTKSGSSYSFPTAITPNQIILGEDATNRYIGYIDDFRITKGVARYTANFTPPTVAFPNR